jgi:hypothetical protein
MRRGAALIAAITLLTACGSSAKPVAKTPAPAATAAATTAATATPAVTVEPQDQAACADLYARLKRVTLALSSSSSLIAQSENPATLSKRIQTQQQQLSRSAQLMDSAVVPKPLVAANRRLVKALRTFAADFGRAKAPAKQGDFQTAVTAMRDKPVTDAIIAAAGTIQSACGTGG